jgi:hypothetical protein
MKKISAKKASARAIRRSLGVKKAHAEVGKAAVRAASAKLFEKHLGAAPKS